MHLVVSGGNAPGIVEEIGPVVHARHGFGSGLQPGVGRGSGQQRCSALLYKIRNLSAQDGRVLKIEGQGGFRPDDQIGLVLSDLPSGQSDVFVDGGLLKGTVPFQALVDVTLNNADPGRVSGVGLCRGEGRVSEEAEEHQDTEGQSRGSPGFREPSGPYRTGGEYAAQSIFADDRRSLDKCGPGDEGRGQGEPGEAGQEDRTDQLQPGPDQPGEQTESDRAEPGFSPVYGCSKGRGVASHGHAQKDRAGQGQSPRQVSEIAYGDRHPVQSRPVRQGSGPESRPGRSFQRRSPQGHGGQAQGQEEGQGRDLKNRIGRPEPGPDNCAQTEQCGPPTPGVLQGEWKSRQESTGCFWHWLRG